MRYPKNAPRVTAIMTQPLYVMNRSLARSVRGKHEEQGDMVKWAQIPYMSMNA
jgi:hypothetical protein